ncbi:MAG: indolepyruvate ferredoxin oxidoreductase [Bacteroidetes bacterium]|nr:indolepyruvate ferredoxin oxidoreductase [Bacteroidota bacterium]
MQKMLLLGDEAIAQGAIDAGISGIYAYPGTPSTEITEFIQKSKEAKVRGIRSEWSANEKTAMESALGMSYTGKRTIVCMKHVGLNVAADPFINAAITGANGGLIILSADDPSMHSSQNEQDSRFFGDFAMIPVLEPSNQQEAYDMVRYGFDLSEEQKIPVLLRITTRLAHSRSGVLRGDIKEQNQIRLPENPTQFILLPVIARKQYKVLLEKQNGFEKQSERSGFNQYFETENRSLGIITCGLAYNYLMENYSEHEIPYPVLKIGQYPVPTKMVDKIYTDCDELLILEDGYPLLEKSIRGFLNKGKKIRGRLDGSLPRDGELNPNIVAVSLGLDDTIGEPIPEFVVGRPPSLCNGCSHNDAFLALNEALNMYTRGRVFSDIGCYTLSALKPLESINTCVDMGASITMAMGAADAGLVPAVAAIGDSTFTHSGMTGLLDAINNNSPITVIILDNATTGMTGGQKSSALGKIESICIGLGVEEEHIRILKPLSKQHDNNVEAIKEELEYNGVSVLILRRECIQTLNKRMRTKHKAKQLEI